MQPKTIQEVVGSCSSWTKNNRLTLSVLSVSVAVSLLFSSLSLILLIFNSSSTSSQKACTSWTHKHTHTHTNTHRISPSARIKEEATPGQIHQPTERVPGVRVYLQTDVFHMFHFVLQAVQPEVGFLKRREQL